MFETEGMMPAKSAARESMVIADIVDRASTPSHFHEANAVDDLLKGAERKQRFRSGIQW
jgi:hypothetical protein